MKANLEEYIIFSRDLETDLNALKRKFYRLEIKDARANDLKPELLSLLSKPPHEPRCLKDICKDICDEMEQIIKVVEKSSWKIKSSILLNKQEELIPTELQTIRRFYILYAIISECFNPIKNLYQILLKEYEELGLLNEVEVLELREKAVGEIAESLCRQEWRGESNLYKRSKFRFEMLKIIRRKIHAKENEERPAALCLSGGGIRSATFCLGVLQGLARNNLLDNFDYLSTVSGGGYIGSWFSAWLYREGSMDKVQSALSKSGGFPYLFGLNDIKIEFAVEGNDKSKETEKLRLLKTILSESAELFFRAENNGLPRKRLKPAVFDLDRIFNPRYELKAVEQILCQELNRIILNEECESDDFKKEIAARLEGDKGQKRIKIKRDIIDDKLKRIFNPLDEFEHIEPPEITYLRSYSNFMSPRPGLFSVDTWTLVATYFRNLLLNWTVFLPLIAMFLLLPRLYLALAESRLISKTVQAPNQYFLLIFGTIAVFAVAAVFNIIVMRPSLSELSWSNQHYTVDKLGILVSAEAKVRRWCLVPLLIVAFGITAAWVWTGELKDYKWTGKFLPAEYFAPETAKFIVFVLFYEVLFLGGFILSHPLLSSGVIKKIKEMWSYARGKVRERFGAARDEVKAATSDAERVTIGKYGVRWVREFGVSVAGGALGGAVLYLFANLLQRAAALNPEIVNTLYVCFAPSLFLITVLLTTAFFVGVAGTIYDDMDREWLSRFGAWILIIIIGWSILSSVVLFGPELLKSNWGEILPSAGIIGTVTGLITLVLGFSGKSPATDEKASEGKIAILIKFAPLVAAPVFALILIILISYGTVRLTEYAQKPLADTAPIFADLFGFPQSGFLNNLLKSKFFYQFFWFALLAAIGSLMGWFVSINKFSLHAMYRERLIRAYLGASRTERRLKTANSFTDLDGEDNVEMHKLSGQKPFHVVNMTLNLGKSNNLRWQNRKAESFTVTALHCGSSNMGDGSGNYRHSREYGYSQTNRQAITLGTAAAISGAAVSTNMGYYSMSSAVSFLMALFNIRLGWWLGNPGKRGSDTYNRSAPRFSPRLFRDEALGSTGDTNPYVYLSDGGHFENLGLYEMVLRRCHYIVLCDAGADLKFGFSDLGTAIHKIRVDMGIPIVFDKDKSPTEGRNCAIARIMYSAIDEKAEDGCLIYIKPTLDGNEPIDIVNYKNVNPDFPHETTIDEFYSETQFESYRTLGLHMIETISRPNKSSVCAGFADLVKNAEEYLNNLDEQRDYIDHKTEQIVIDKLNTIGKILQ